MWHETDSTGDRTWRGSVHEIATGRKYYVTEPDQITDFISTRLRGEPNAQ
jgi:hypothetical protein